MAAHVVAPEEEILQEGTGIGHEFVIFPQTKHFVQGGPFDGLDGILADLAPKTSHQDGVTFYWREDQDPDSYAAFRVSGDGEQKRDVRDVPVQEVANAVYTVLLEQISMVREDLIRETAKKLGYTRLGGNVTAAMEAGLQWAEDAGCISFNSTGSCLLTESGTVRANETIATFRTE